MARAMLAAEPNARIQELLFDGVEANASAG